jgi:hypothetical protein
VRIDREAEQEEELIELAPGETSLDFLQRVYRSVKQPMSRRLRAAIEALPHEHHGSALLQLVTCRATSSRLALITASNEQARHPS